MKLCHLKRKHVTSKENHIRNNTCLKCRHKYAGIILAFKLKKNIIYNIIRKEEKLVAGTSMRG